MTNPEAERATGITCWIGLVDLRREASRRFYEELFGWKAQEPSQNSAATSCSPATACPSPAGMGEMGDLPADNSWKGLPGLRRHRENGEERGVRRGRDHVPDDGRR